VASGPRTFSLETPGLPRWRKTPLADPAFPIVSYLTANHPTLNLKSYGSAVLIAPHFALTAAHNVYDPAKFGAACDGYASGATMTPGYSVAGASAGAMQPAARSVCHERFVSTGDIDFDIALLFFTKPNDHASTFPLLKPAAMQTPSKVRVVGYPATAHAFAMYEHESALKAERGGRIFYEADTEQGQSGGAVFASGASRLTLIGIHTYGHEPTPPDLAPANSATALSSALLAWIEHQKEILKGG
jgi:glutamyl endopeptidase